jgi:hypothetical protein
MRAAFIHVVADAVVSGVYIYTYTLILIYIMYMHVYIYVYTCICTYTLFSFTQLIVDKEYHYELSFPKYLYYTVFVIVALIIAANFPNYAFLDSTAAIVGVLIVYLLTDVDTYIYIHKCICICLFIHINLFIYLYMYTNININICICLIKICMCI